MWPYETSNKLINNTTNYKLWDQNIKDILDAFNNNDNRDKIVSEQIGFFENLINSIAKNNNTIEKTCPKILTNYTEQIGWELDNIKFDLLHNTVINVSDFLDKTKIKVYNMSYAHSIIGERWKIIQKDMETWWAFYDQPTNCIFINQRTLNSNLLFAILLHEIGHANDPKFSIGDDIDRDNIEKITDKQWKMIILNHSRAERYAHAFMLNKLRKYQNLPHMDQYIWCCKKVIDSTLMTYKYYYLKNILWLWKKWIINWQEYNNLYKKN